MNRETNVKKLFCLMGYCSVGKDTIQKAILEQYEGRIEPVVSTTTRPMRKGETEGVEYYFIDDKTFFEKGADFVEKRIYHTKIEENGEIKDTTWRYGIERQELEKNDYLITIVDADGFKELKDYLGNNRIVPIFISTPMEELKVRALARGDLEEEVDRRLADDVKKFRDFRVRTVFETVKNEQGKLDEAVAEVRRIIDLHIRMTEYK